MRAMRLCGYNNPRRFSDVLSGQDCTLREQAKAREFRPDKSRCGDMETAFALAADSGSMTGYSEVIPEPSVQLRRGKEWLF